MRWMSDPYRMAMRDYYPAIHLRKSSEMKKLPGIPENAKINKATLSYKGFKITAEREISLGEEELLYYSIFRDRDEWEMESGFSSGDESSLEMIEYLRRHVDDYLKHPEEYDK
jgi:hypothetical protein